MTLPLCIRRLICRLRGHIWRQRGENWAVRDCTRCGAHQLLLAKNLGGEGTTWLTTP